MNGEQEKESIIHVKMGYKNLCLCHPSARLLLLNNDSRVGFFYCTLTLMIHSYNHECDRGGSRISGKGAHMYKRMGVCFADLISFFLNIP